MADATAEFFDDLSRRGNEPLLGKLRLTVRFDIVDGKRTDHWLLGLDDGAIDVTRADGEAECVIRADKAEFDKVASGRTNAMAAYLRGALTLDGEPRQLVRLQRLFPAPVGMPEVSGDRAVGKRRS
jgi:putative sterol carrier protein